MRVHPLFITIFGLYFLTTSFLSQSHATETKIVAQVGRIPVTIFDIGREQQKLLPFNMNYHSGIPKETLEKMRLESLNTMIEKAYKVNYALDNNIKIDKKTIDANLESLKKKYKTEKEFKAALGEESISELRASIEHSALAKKAEEVAVFSKINITDSDVRAYYETNKQAYKRPKQFKASHILVKVNPASNSEERIALEKKARELAEKAKRGDDFYNLAYYNSDDRSKYVGGDLGYFHEGQTVPEFEDAIKKMKTGEISDPVKTMFGWHIIKLVELNEAKQLDFDESKAKIREQLEKTEKDKLYNSWLADLREKYPVKKF